MVCGDGVLDSWILYVVEGLIFVENFDGGEAVVLPYDVASIGIGCPRFIGALEEVEI